MPRRRNPENAAAIDETARTPSYAAEELDEAEDQAAEEAAQLAREAAVEPEAAPAEVEPETPIQEADAPEQAPEPEQLEPLQEAVIAEQTPEQEESEPVRESSDAPSPDGDSEPEDETAEREQTVQPVQPEQELPPLSLRVQIHSGHPTDDIAATADVEIGGVCTIRNVKVKNDDYGLEVVMPRTKMPDTGRFRDACVFPRREMRSQFDMAVLSAYQQEMGMTQTQDQPEREGGMGIRM